MKFPRRFTEEPNAVEPLLGYVLRIVDSTQSKKIHGIFLRPGQVLIGTLSAARALPISKSTVYRRLKKYENLGWFHCQTAPNRRGTIISVPALMNEGIGGPKAETVPDTHTDTLASLVEVRSGAKRNRKSEPQAETQAGTEAGDNQERKKEYIPPLVEQSFLTDKNKKNVSSYMELRDFWCSEYLEKHGAAYKWTGRDGKDLKGLLDYAETNYDGTGVEKIKQGIEAYLTDDDPWISEHGHPLWVFAKEPQRWFSKIASSSNDFPRIY